MNARTVVVGVDGSPGTARTLGWIVSMFRGSDAEIVAVHCLPPLLEDHSVLSTSDLQRWEAQRREAFHARFRSSWCAPLRAGGIGYRTRVVVLEPAEGLQHVADEEDADLIVVGSHGHGRFGTGRVPSKLLCAGTRPLIVVPTLRRDRETECRPGSQSPTHRSDASDAPPGNQRNG